MRLPWLQIDADGQTRARMLARLLGVPEPHGMGLAIGLWHAVVEFSRDGDFSGTVPSIEFIAAACAWPIDDAKRLVDALQQVGLVAVHPELRVRGLDRYRRTWEKNQNFHRKPKRAKFGSDVPSTGAKPANDGAEDEDEEEETTTHVSLTLVEVEPTPPAREVFEHWRQATGKARAVLDAKRRDLIDRRLAEGHSVDDLKAAIDGYVRSPWHQGQNDRQRKFLGLDLMLRDAAHIEAGFDLLMQHNAATPPPPKTKFLTADERKNLYADG